MSQQETKEYSKTPPVPPRPSDEVLKTHTHTQLVMPLSGITSCVVLTAALIFAQEMKRTTAYRKSKPIGSGDKVLF